MPDLETPSVATRNGADASVLTSPLTTPLGQTSGEGLDRRRAKRRFTPRRIGMAVGVLALIALIGYAIWGRGEDTQLRVPAERLTIGSVLEAPFQEYVAVTGTAQPLRTVLLDAVVGGQVVQRLVDEGDSVTAGQPLFILKNDNTALDVMNSEAQIEEQISTMRQSRLALDQNQLNLQQQLAELDYSITRLEREEVRTAGLQERGAVATQDLERIRDELAYTRQRRELTLEAHQNDQAQRQQQVRDMEASVGRLRENLAFVRGTRNDLVVRAPVNGQFSGLEAEIGELKTRGSRLGQIDVLDEVKVRVPIDEHYLPRVAPGQTGTATVDGVEYAMRIRTVYPEVSNGRFDAEMVFDGPTPADTRRGQSLRIRLELGDPETALLLPRGGFYGDTGGQWVYVLGPDGQTAHKRDVQLGRQNPQHFEVTGGLADGDRVVTSSYAAFGDADVLILE